MIDGCLTPTLAVFQLNRGVIILIEECIQFKTYLSNCVKNPNSAASIIPYHGLYCEYRPCRTWLKDGRIQKQKLCNDHICMEAYKHG